MKLTIGYDEIQNFILAKFNRPVKIYYMGDATIAICGRASVQIPIFGRVERDFDLTAKVEHVDEYSITLTYHTSMAVEAIIRGAVTLLRERVPYLQVADNRIEIRYREIEEIQRFARIGRLDSISFEENGVYCNIEDIDFNQILILTNE